MRVELRLLGGMKRLVNVPASDSGISYIDVEGGLRLSDLLDGAGVDASKTLVVLLNGRHPGGDPVLGDGDTVSVFPPVAGG